MEISSVASQALSLRDQTTNSQLGIAAMKQAVDSEKKLADVLAASSEIVKETSQSEGGRFSTYA